MKLVVLGFLVIGGLLIGLGLRSSNDMSQSADVRSGGALPILIGGVLVVIGLLIGAIYVFVRA